MSQQTRLSRRQILKGASILGLGTALAACQPKVVEVEKVVTQVVEKEVTKIVEGTPQVVKETVVVEKAVTAVVEKKKNVELTFHHIDAANYGAFTEFFNKDFVEPKYPHIKTQSAFIPGWADYLPKMMTMQASGTIGDIIFSFTPNWLAMMTAKEIFCAHDELADAAGFDFSPYFPGGIDACTMAGHLRSLPWHGHAGHSTHVINLTLFEEAGIEPPPIEAPYEWDIDYELEFGPKVTQDTNGDGKTDIFSRTLSGTNYDHITCIAQSFGASVLSEDGRECTIGSDEGRAAIKWIYQRAYENTYAPTSANVEGNERQMFVSGKLGIYQVCGSHATPIMKEVGDRFEVGCAIHPTGPAGIFGGLHCVNTLGITNNCKNKEDAWDALVMHCGGEAGVQKVLYGAGSPGARFDCFEHPEVLKRFAGAKTLLYQMENTHPDPIPWNWRCSEERDALLQNLQEIWAGNATVDEGIDKAVAAVEEVLALEAL